MERHEGIEPSSELLALAVWKTAAQPLGTCRIGIGTIAET